MALHAGVGVTWYTWLEQGRPINASAQVLDAIGRTLRLDSTELRHLYRLAEVPGLPEPEPTAKLEPVVQAVLDDFASFPACVITPRFDVLAWNRPYEALWPRIRTRTEHNLMWLAFTIPACCSSFVNRDEELPALVAAFRTEYGRHLGDPEWERFVTDLSDASEDFARLWRMQDVACHATRQKRHRHPAVGEVTLLVSQFAIAASPGCELLVYVPEDPGSRTRVQWLLDHPDAPAWSHEH
ncbi:helix-turn-helix transcriptional regulator [Streptacidiphilus monticola]